MSATHQDTGTRADAVALWGETKVREHELNTIRTHAERGALFFLLCGIPVDVVAEGLGLTRVAIHDERTASTWPGVLADGTVFDASGHIDPDDIGWRFRVVDLDGNPIG